MFRRTNLNATPPCGCVPVAMHRFCEAAGEADDTPGGALLDQLCRKGTVPLENLEMFERMGVISLS